MRVAAWGLLPNLEAANTDAAIGQISWQPSNYGLSNARWPLHSCHFHLRALQEDGLDLTGEHSFTVNYKPAYVLRAEGCDCGAGPNGPSILSVGHEVRLGGLLRQPGRGSCYALRGALVRGDVQRLAPQLHPPRVPIHLARA